MTKIIHREQGYTLMTLVLTLGLIAFFALLILKIAPIYINHSKVINALAALEKTTDVQTMSENEVRGNLDKRFNLNYVEKVTKDDITVTQSGNYLKVEIAYDVIENIWGNLNVLVEFDDVIEVGTP